MITPWREIAGYKCSECGDPASHFFASKKASFPLCCQCHQKMGSYYQIPLFSAEDTKFAHEMIAKEKREQNKYGD